MTDRSDVHDISDALVRYATGIDTRDWPLFRTVFTDDCELDYGEIGAWHGVDAVVEFMTVAHEMAGHTMHRITNQVVSVDGDSATARAYVDALDHVAGQQVRRQCDRVLRRRVRPHRPTVGGCAGGVSPRYC